LREHANFSCVLQGDKKVLQKIKEHIIREYVKVGMVKLSKPIYHKNEIYIVTTKEWEEYQKLKKYKEEGLIGAEFL
jgi:hypothetical protein